MQEQLRAKHHV